MTPLDIYKYLLKTNPKVKGWKELHDSLKIVAESPLYPKVTKAMMKKLSDKCKKS